mgnify:CR=1 FL=1|tara:strand:- start:322 stop:765 length:444 start_codon:yes stop_codon:yes gene_type:complete
MKSKTNIRTVIRKMVREEVAMAIQEVITELKQPIQQVSKPKQKKKIVEKTKYSNNSVLNDVLNETAVSDEWKSIGGGKFDSSRMNEVMSSQYGELMNGGGEVNADVMIASLGANPKEVDDNVKDIFTKDYRSLMKKVDEKSKQKRGA